jgi:hypothetical protein
MYFVHLSRLLVEAKRQRQKTNLMIAAGVACLAAASPADSQVSVRLSIREGNRATCERVASKPVTPGMTRARHYFNLPTFLYNSNSTDYLKLDERLRLYADAPTERGAARLALHCHHVPAGGGVGGSAGRFGMSATTSYLFKNPSDFLNESVC